MALDRSLDAPRLRNVHAHPNDQDASSAPAFGPAADSDYTGRVVTPTKTLKPKRSVRKRPTVRLTLLSVSSSPSSANCIHRSACRIRILQVPPLTQLPS